MNNSRESSLIVLKGLTSALVALIVVICCVGDHTQSQSKTQRPNRRVQTSVQNSQNIEIYNGNEAVAGEALVRFKTIRSLKRISESLFTRFGKSMFIDSFEKLNDDCYLIHSSTLNITQLIEKLDTLKQLTDRAEPNYVIRADRVPNDPLFSKLWALLNTGQPINAIGGTNGVDIHAVEAWDTTTGSQSVVVAILDTGISFCHPDLVHNTWTASKAFTVQVGSKNIPCSIGTHGYDFIANTCYPRDDKGHGSHVSGIIGAEGDNHVGVVGVNWHISMMALKILDGEGQGNVADAIRAIKFAVELKKLGIADIRILNNSWGVAGDSRCLFDQIDEARRYGMLFVVAAGNSSKNIDVKPAYPASYKIENIISVAAVDNNGELALFSNYGRESVHLAAPGVDILSTEDCDNYIPREGTSQAAPLVSGAAALLLSHRLVSTSELKKFIIDNVEPSNLLHNKTISGGRLNVYKAIKAMDSQK